MSHTLRQYVAGGYFLSIPNAEPDRYAQMPRHITLGWDHCPRLFFPPSELLTWSDTGGAALAAAAAPFGLAGRRLLDARRFADEQFDRAFGAWHVIYSLAAARRLAGTFLTRSARLELWGAGLPVALAQRFVKQSTPPASPAGCAPVGAGGVCRMVARRRSLAGGGTPLGHEILAYEMTAFQSVESLHGDPSVALAHAQVRPNELGLIDALADARRVAAATDPAIGRRPGRQRTDWMPWLLVRYPIV